MTDLHSSEWLAGQALTRAERRAALLRLGRQGRLAAYRRGELDFDSCCSWAARWTLRVARRLLLVFVPTQQRADGRTRAPRQLLCRVAGVSPCATCSSSL